MADQRENFVSSFMIPRFPVSLRQREANLYRLLSNVPVAGVTGMSGVGKSALASLLFQTRRVGYQKVSFLENVRGRRIEDVQRQLLYDLCGIVDWDMSNYGMKIRQCIGNLRVLIVVDDVGCEDDLVALQLSAFFEEKVKQKQSKAIITGQDWQVMQEYVSTVGRVHVEPLTEQDATALFFHYALDGTAVAKERRQFETAAGEIVRACAGNPLSLQVVGEFLGKKAANLVGTAELLEIYKEALYKLRHAQVLGGSKSNDKLWTRLWHQVDDLDEPEREMFVDFASFAAAQPASSATASREAVVNHAKSGSPRISLQNLIDKSLIVEHPGGHLSMHNLLRVLGSKIAFERYTKTHHHPNNVI